MFARRPLELIHGLGVAQHLAVFPDGVERVVIGYGAVYDSVNFESALVAMEAKPDEVLPRGSGLKCLLGLPRGGEKAKPESLPINVQQPIVQGPLHDIRFAILSLAQINGEVRQLVRFPSGFGSARRTLRPAFQSPQGILEWADCLPSVDLFCGAAFCSNL